MKISFVVGDISTYGGTERVASEVVAALSEAGHDVTIHSLFGPAEPWFELPGSVTVVSAGLEPAGRSFRRALAISRYLHEVQKQNGVRAVILVDSILFAFCLPWVFRFRTKIICWEHFNVDTNHGTRMRAMARLAASRFSYRVVVLTETEKVAWQRKYLVRGRVEAISNPVPRFSEVQLPALKTDGDGGIVLAVGRLTHVKGFDLLLEAWRSLGNIRRGWVLRIVGDGEEEQTLKTLVSEYKLDDSVVFVGRVSDMAWEYRSASIYVLSSRREGLSMTLIEAQHFGLPCIAADCPTGPREVLSQGAGLLVKPGDWHALAEGLTKMMLDADLRIKMSDLAVENVKRYSPNSIRVQWESLFLA